MGTVLINCLERTNRKQLHDLVNFTVKLWTVFIRDALCLLYLCLVRRKLPNKITFDIDVGMVVHLDPNYDDSRFSQSRDITGAATFLMRHVTLLAPLLRVICPPYAGTL